MIDPESNRVEKYDLIKNKLQTRLSIPLTDGGEIDTRVLQSMMIEDFDRLTEIYDW